MCSDKPLRTHAPVDGGGDTEKRATGIGAVGAIDHAVAPDLLALAEGQFFGCRELEFRQATQ